MDWVAATEHKENKQRLPSVWVSEFYLQNFAHLTRIVPNLFLHLKRTVKTADLYAFIACVHFKLS